MSTDFSFSDQTRESNRIWTAGFLNERFPEPVSPLGWTLIREWYEELALRAPLRYLGVHWPSHRAMTRLYQGHPYSDAEAFWSLYKLFPDALLPEDAVRYFPQGDTLLRKTVSQPASLADPRVVGSLLMVGVRDFGNWSLWHNWRRWKQFELALEDEIGNLNQAADYLERDLDMAETGTWWAVLDRTIALNRQLLAIHRWSLTHADLTYTLLRRLLRRRFEPHEVELLSASLVSGAPNLSLALDRDLSTLAALRKDGSPEFGARFAAFLATHGHRSFSLDICHRPFGADPQLVLTLIEQETGDDGKPCPNEDLREVRARVKAKFGPIDALLVDHVVDLARTYMALREDQRYRWQQALAVLRRLVQVVASHWHRVGLLASTEDIFFLTWSEFLTEAAKSTPTVDRERIEARKSDFSRLQQEYRLDPVGHYPAFLAGDKPLDRSPACRLTSVPSVYWGRPASPGWVRGPARRVLDPSGFATVAQGDILVAPSTDPGWTPVFKRISALITERGGLLSHGAVVAREYRVPAVVGVAGIIEAIEDGQWIEIDGRSGCVKLLSKHEIAGGH